jgi:hypothetical protein
MTPERERSNTIPNSYPYFNAPDPVQSSPTPANQAIHSETLMTPHYYTHDRGRSSSIDSVPSINPSLSESINTLSRLIPASPPSQYAPPSPIAEKVLPPVPRNASFNLSAQNNLTQDERSVLTRRARKLEKILGEPLGENQMAHFVVDPSTSGVTITTRVSENAWPCSPVSGIYKLPDWAKEDCVPRRVHDRIPDPPPGTITRSESFARKAKDALGITGERDKNAGEVEDLKVYLSRETRVSESTLGGRGIGGFNVPRTPHRGNPHGNVSPASPNGTVDSFWTDEGDDAIRRGRRLQLAKVSSVIPLRLRRTHYKPATTSAWYSDSNDTHQ